MGKRGTRPQGKISTEWSTNLAYAIGLIATDGCLSSDGRHLELNSKDLEQIVNFKNCLKITNKIGRKGGGYSNDKNFRIQFGDILFYNWLLGIGLTPSKSKSIGILKIPDQFFFDFLRGCFDGDGSIYAYWDPRWKSSYMFYLTFTSASPAFLSWLKDTINRLVGVKGRITKGGRVFNLRFAKAGTLSIWNRMYHSKNIPYLARKFTKAQEIFRIDGAHNAQVAERFTQQVEGLYLN